MVCKWIVDHRCKRGIFTVASRNEAGNSLLIGLLEIMRMFVLSAKPRMGIPLGFFTFLHYIFSGPGAGKIKVDSQVNLRDATG